MKVDVILPVYKAKSFVFEAIDSVINQTYKDWHLYIIDDNSGDDCLKSIKSRYLHVNNISYYQSDINRRAAGSRNLMIEKSKGDLIGFLDQDDVWHKDKLLKQTAYLEHNKHIAALHTNIDFIDEKSNIIIKMSQEENDFRAAFDWETSSRNKLIEYQINYNKIRLVSALIRRPAFIETGGFDAKLFGGEDWEFWLRFFYYGFKIGLQKDVLLYRRFHNDNTSKIYEYERLMNKIQAYEKAANLLTGYKDLIARKKKALLKKVFRFSLRKRNMRLAASLFWKIYL